MTLNSLAINKLSYSAVNGSPGQANEANKLQAKKLLLWNTTNTHPSECCLCKTEAPVQYTRGSAMAVGGICGKLAQERGKISTISRKVYTVLGDEVSSKCCISRIGRWGFGVCREKQQLRSLLLKPCAQGSS